MSFRRLLFYPIKSQWQYVDNVDDVDSVYRRGGSSDSAAFADDNYCYQVLRPSPLA